MIEFLKVNLSNNIAIFIIIILFFFCAILIIKNKKLKQEIGDLKLEIKPTLKKETITKEDIIPIKNISKEIKEENLELKENKETNKLEELPKIKPIKNNKPKPENKKPKIELYQKEYPQKKIQTIKEEQKKEPYTKNILQNTPKITSPVSINNETIEENSKFNINEFVKKEKKTTQKKKEQTKEEYLKEISEQIASEIKPQTIELTEYEKNEEENAIISYKELLNAKDKIKMLDDEDETIDFIEELKKLRNSLN